MTMRQWLWLMTRYFSAEHAYAAPQPFATIQDVLVILDETKVVQPAPMVLPFWRCLSVRRATVYRGQLSHIHSSNRRRTPCQQPSRSQISPQSRGSASPEFCSGCPYSLGACCSVQRSSTFGYLQAHGAHRPQNPCPCCRTANDGRWTRENSLFRVRPHCFWRPLARSLPDGRPVRDIERCFLYRLQRSSAF